jgi:hypothetical protein
MIYFLFSHRITLLFSSRRLKNALTGIKSRHQIAGNGTDIS